MTTVAAAKPALFIVAASSRFARGRVERVVVKGIDELRGSPSEETVALADSLRLADGRIHAWSIHTSRRFERAWELMSMGDWMLFYQMGFFSAAARVSEHIDSPDLAAAIWGEHEAEELRRVIAFNEAHAVWAKAWPYREIVGGRFMGFRRLAEERQEQVRATYGSVEAFVRQSIIPQRSPREP